VLSLNYYNILGVDQAESLEGIHTAYRRLAKQCHPDLAGVHSKEKFQGIQEAYEVLSDPDKRKDYDAVIDKGSRIKGKSGIEPEPLVPSPNPLRRTYPEPLVREPVPIEDFFSSSSSHCSYCKGFKSGAQNVCPFCQAFGPTEDDVLQFVMRSLQWFRVQRF
jgi:DnaJ-class molecular chaperone